MNKINTNLTNKFVLAAFLALGTLAVTSCNNNKNEIGQEVPDGKSQIVVRIAGVSDGDDIVKKGSISRKSNGSTIKLTEEKGFDGLVSVDNKIESPSANDGISSKIALTASNKTRAAGDPMAPNMKYRLFLYKKNGANYTFDQSVLLTVGQEAPIAVTQGATYKWTALSYNTTDNVPDRGTNDNLPLPGDKDVLFAASTEDITIGNTTANIAITFKHAFSRIAIELNTMGMFAPLTNSTTVSVSGFTTKTGTIDLSTGNFVSLSAPVTPTIDYTTFTDVNSTGEQRVAYFYTADEAQQNVKVKLNNITLTLDNGSTRTFGPNAPYEPTTPITPLRGKNHRIRVAIAESAITRSGVAWSRANLYYKAGANPYRFHHFNDQTNDLNSYFSYGGYKPRTLAKKNAAKDPCAFVYPAGLWKTPSKADLNAVTSYENDLVNIVGNIIGGLFPSATPGTEKITRTSTFIQFPITSGFNAAYGDANSAQNKLRFNFNGYQRTVNAVEGLIQLQLGNTYGEQAGFWTNDRLLNVPIVDLGVGATSFLGFNAEPLINLTGAYYPTGTKAVGLLNLDLLGLDLLNSSLMNVRCVRDASWNTKKDDPSYDPNPVIPN